MLNLKRVTAVAMIAAALSGCYVMPLNQSTGPGGYSASDEGILPSNI